MAVEHSIIEAVRIMDADGISIEYPWDSKAWYLVRDDQPYLEFRTRGKKAQVGNSEAGNIELVSEQLDEGTQWQKWDFETEVSYRRRLGEISLELKVPKACLLRCYIIPTLLLNFRDVVTMVEEIKEELGVEAAWDRLADRRDKAWTQPVERALSNVPVEMIKYVEEELRAALLIRRTPFEELASPSGRDTLLAENALVSHWASRRSEQINKLVEMTEVELASQISLNRRGHSPSRKANNEREIKRLNGIIDQLASLRSALMQLITVSELTMSIYPSPLLQRDYRLRLLLRVFAPSSSQALSEIEAARSHYPPMILNGLWELWGAVWLAKELRRLGFLGLASPEGLETVSRCSWRLRKGEITVELDLEAKPSFIDYDRLPPVYERTVSTMDWAARNQELDVERPYLALEMHCSPDYLLRITTPTQKVLIVGDACLASPKHHGKRPSNSNTKPKKPKKQLDETDAGKEDVRAKPHIVELYRRTIGWVTKDRVVGCHPLGGFVLYPPPSDGWKDFERLPGASDCTLLCPRPGGDPQASKRLKQMLARMVPELDDPYGPIDCSFDD